MQSTQWRAESLRTLNQFSVTATGPAVARSRPSSPWRFIAPATTGSSAERRITVRPPGSSQPDGARSGRRSAAFVADISSHGSRSSVAVLGGSDRTVVAFLRNAVHDADFRDRRISGSIDPRGDGYVAADTMPTPQPLPPAPRSDPWPTQASTWCTRRRRPGPLRRSGRPSRSRRGRARLGLLRRRDRWLPSRRDDARGLYPRHGDAGSRELARHQLHPTHILAADEIGSCWTRSPPCAQTPPRSRTPSSTSWKNSMPAIRPFWRAAPTRFSPFCRMRR